MPNFHFPAIEVVQHRYSSDRLLSSGQWSWDVVDDDVCFAVEYDFIEADDDVFVLLLIMIILMRMMVMFVLLLMMIILMLMMMIFCWTPLGSLHCGPPLSAPPPQDPTKKIFACHHWFIRHKHAHQNLLKNYQKCACFNFIDNTTKTIPNPKCLNFRTVNATNVSAFVMDIKLMLILRSPKVSHLVS